MSKTHIVVSGDTLYSLGKKYGLTVNELKLINGLSSDTIKIGQVLKVVKTVHTIVSGDTLFSLSKRYGTTVENLKSLNGLKNDTIKIGQILKLPELYIGQFVLKNEQNNPFKNFAYEMTLSDGTICRGTTDSEGCTEVITANRALTIKEVKIISNDISCCSHYNHEFAAGSNSYAYVILGELKLTSESTLPKITFLKTESRSLTDGEEKKLREIFGNSLIYDDIKVHKGKIIRYQKDDIAMTPLGDAYFPPQKYEFDFSDTSKVTIGRWHLFVHEMVHVWQHQRKKGYVAVAGLQIGLQNGYEWDNQFPNYPIAYNYVHLLDKRTHFSEFNIEQQASMIADYFVYKGNSQQLNPQVEMKLQNLLQDFVKDPKNTDLLPKTNDINHTVWNDKTKPILEMMKNGESN